MPDNAERSLYQRLGGYDAIAAVTDDFLERIMSDSDIGYYWAGDGFDTKRRDRQLVVDYMCEATGGPVYYIGRDMRTIHHGLGIKMAEYDILMRHLDASLDKFNVPETEREQVRSFLNGLRDDIVEFD